MFSFDITLFLFSNFFFPLKTTKVPSIRRLWGFQKEKRFPVTTFRVKKLKREKRLNNGGKGKAAGREKGNGKVGTTHT